jgi:hypothetical protein
MTPQPLYFHWDYREVDQRFWGEHLADWVPARMIDAHTHVMHPRFRTAPMTEAMRRQYWVNEVFEPIDAECADRCLHTVFPGREVTCLAFGFPDLDFDLEAGNAWLQTECARRRWRHLAVVCPHWSQAAIAACLDQPATIGLKPYYALIGANRETRDAHVEASIFEFLTPAMLEVANDRGAWVTLHVPKAARLGHPDNLREIREIRRRYPQVVLVLAHLGRCYTEPHAREALPAIADDPGILVDTSAVLNPASHRVALECLGPARVLYGSDNPILYMRGRRQYHDRTYINRTNHPFHFNREREPAEVEATYTLYMYEDLRALRQACCELGLTGRDCANALFHDNAARLIAQIERRKLGSAVDLAAEPGSVTRGNERERKSDGH